MLLHKSFSGHVMFYPRLCVTGSNDECNPSVFLRGPYPGWHALLQVMEMVGLDTEWMLNDLLACADAVYA